MVSNAVIISWYTILISIVTFPLMIAILMRVKYKTKFSPFLLGLLVYFSFGVFATSVVNTLFISENRPTYSFLTGNVVTYSLYFAVVTGIMEMLGLFMAYKKILVNYDEKETSVTLALGHAEMEGLMVCFLALAAYISWATVLNERGPAGFAEYFADVEGLNIEEAIDSITSVTVSEVVLLALQRVIYLGMNIFLSVMIFYAAKKDIRSYFWVAVVFRGLCTVPGSVERYNELKDVRGNSALLTAFLAVVVAMLGYMSIKLYKAYDAGKILYPADLFKKHPDPHF